LSVGINASRWRINARDGAPLRRVSDTYKKDCVVVREARRIRAYRSIAISVARPREPVRSDLFARDPHAHARKVRQEIARWTL
jgi:hypothetical protein